jgi:hypothetical protein
MSFKVLNPGGTTAVEVKDAYVDFTVGPNEVVDIEDLYLGELWRLTFSTMDPTLSPPYTPPTDADGGALYTAISTGALIRVKNDGTTQLPWPAVAASKIIQDLTYTADYAWAYGNNITIRYVDDVTSGNEYVEVVDNAITVHIEDGVTTADTIKTIVDASTLAARLVDVTVSGTGATEQVAQAVTNLEDGSDDPFADAIWLWHPNKYQWLALAGSYGAPSEDNVFVTEQDPRSNAGTATQPVAATTTNGTLDNYARTDHTHQGIHGVKANGVGTQRYGDLVLQQGTGVTITDNGLGTFTFDVAPAVTTELQVSEGTGLVADYNAGKATFNGTEYLIAAGTVTVTDDATNYIFVDIDGSVKSNTTGFPPNTMPLAQIVAASGDITSVTDYRSFINQSLVWGVDGDISTVEPDDAAAAGSSEKYARADHIHAVAADIPMFIGETGSGSANVEGNSTSFARANHEHKWQLVSSFVGLPATPVDGQVVWAKYGVYNGLFYYDSTRTKWLSMGESVKHWNSGTNVSTVTVNLISNIDDTQQDNDYPNPYPITITGLLGCQSNVIATDNATKFEVAKFDLTTGTLTQDVADVTLNTVGSRAVRNMAVNVDVGDLTVLSARRLRTGTATGNITRPALSVFYRVRLSA